MKLSQTLIRYSFKPIIKHQGLINFVHFHATLSKTELHTLLRKLFSSLLLYKILGHVNTKNKIRPLLNKNWSSTSTKTSWNWKRCYDTVRSFTLIIKTFSENACISCSVVYSSTWRRVFLSEWTTWNFSPQLKQTLTQVCELTLPFSKNTFFVFVDASAIGVITVLV